MPLVPYLENGSLTVEELVSGVKPHNVTKAYDALRTLARIARMDGLAEAVKDVEQQEKESLERASRDVPAPLRAIQSSEGGSKRRTESDELNADDGVRFSIHNLRETLEPLGRAAPAIVRQRALEDSAMQAAIRELKYAQEQMSDPRAKSSTLAQNQLQSWMYEWLQDLQTYLKTEIEAMTERVAAERRASGADDPESGKAENINLGHSGGHRQAKENILVMYLSVLSPEKLALITILEMMRGIGGMGITDGMKAVRAMSQVGKGVETEYQADTIRSLSGVDSRMWQNVLDDTTQQPQPRMISSTWNKIGKGVRAGETLRAGEVDWSEVWTPSWTLRAHLDVGSWLVEACMKVAKVKRTAVHPKTGDQV